MSRKDAKRMAKDLRAQGKTYIEIGEALKEAGFVSRKTGQALTVGGVCRMFKSKRRKARAIAPSRAARAPRPIRAAVVQVIQAITKLTDVDATTRLSLIELVSDL